MSTENIYLPRLGKATALACVQINGRCSLKIEEGVKCCLTIYSERCLWYKCYVLKQMCSPLSNTSFPRRTTTTTHRSKGSVLHWSQTNLTSLRASDFNSGFNIPSWARNHHKQTYKTLKDECRHARGDLLQPVPWSWRAIFLKMSPNLISRLQA